MHRNAKLHNKFQNFGVITQDLVNWELCPQTARKGRKGKGKNTKEVRKGGNGVEGKGWKEWKEEIINTLII